MMDKETTLRQLFEEKYLDEWPQAMNSLVAPQTPGSKILHILDFEKKGDIYPQFQHKNITDIWWGLSSLVFELSPSADKITVVDPMYHYESKYYMEKENQRAENRMLSTEKIQQQTQKDLAGIYNLQKEVWDGIEKWQKNANNPDPKIVLNDSFAQHVVWIPSESQDIVFFNFVLDKLKGDEGRKKEILAALDNAYRITKSWGKIYGIHNKGSAEDDIIDALNTTDYSWNAQYKDNNAYIVFIIDKA